jgi:hypothetical protein
MEDGIPLVVREVNDRTYNILWGLGAEDGDFACECGRNSCVERVDLLVIQYAARDARPLLAPGHAPVGGAPASLVHSE